MNKFYEHYLVEKYPKLFRDMYGDPKATCMAWGCSCGDGWFYLLETLCRNIQHHIDNRVEAIKHKWTTETELVPQVVFHQIKEKFGALRIYSEGGDDCVRTMINFTESLSTWTCENCGSQTLEVGRTVGWIQCLCPECAAEFKKKIGQRKELLALKKKVIKSRKNPKRAWKGMDEPFSKDDFVPPYVKNKPKVKKKTVKKARK